MYDVVLSKSATLSFDAAHASLQKKLDRCFIILAATPRGHNNIKAMKGKLAGYLRFRVGDYRVLYRIDDAAKQVVVIDIANRKDVYE